MGIHNQALDQVLPWPSHSINSDIIALKQFNHLMPPEIWRWRDSVISDHHGIAGSLIRTYITTARKHGYAAANSQLHESDDRLRVPCLSETGTRLVTRRADISESEIHERAETNAEFCKLTYETHVVKGFYEGITAVKHFVESIGFRFPSDVIQNNFPKIQNEKLAGAVARTCDKKWWLRQLRRELGRKVEQLQRELGSVNRNAEVYLSNWSYRRWQAQQKRNRATLERLEAVNENDEVCSLTDAVDASVSNPAIRRAELMTRMSGYEELANDMGFTALFLTLTTPSKYHERLSSGFKNNRSINATPADAMSHLNGVWARIRAKWNRNDIKAYGFRVAEPHHDGTPHWHMLLFFNPAQAELAWNIFRDEALVEDGDEAGAQEHRATLVNIDENVGTATGYLAKYIAKNIDGESVAVDDEANAPACNTASRTRAWASVWGIRQFQQIGSVSITVWRELRRRTKPLEEWECSEAEALRAAADDGDWALFVTLMGGATVRRDEQTLQPQYKAIEETLSRYGEEIQRLLGVVMRGTARFIKTREHVWRIREKPVSERLEAFEVVAQPPPLDLCQ